MKTKTISIQLDGVVRNTIDKILDIYEGEKGVEIERPLKTLDLQTELGFKTKEELIDFIYIESPMRVFGYSQEVEEGSVFIINEIYKKFRDEYKISIFSNEVEKSKPATLMFLAKTGCLIDNIHFYPLEDYTTIWDDSDIVITSSTNILKTKPDNKSANKLSIKYQTIYNEDNEADFNIKSLKQLLENEYFKRNEFA